MCFEIKKSLSKFIILFYFVEYSKTKNLTVQFIINKYNSNFFKNEK